MCERERERRSLRVRAKEEFARFKTRVDYKKHLRVTREERKWCARCFYEKKKKKKKKKKTRETRNNDRRGGRKRERERNRE